MAEKSFASRHLWAMARTLYVMTTMAAVVIVLIRLQVSGL